MTIDIKRMLESGSTAEDILAAVQKEIDRASKYTPAKIYEMCMNRTEVANRLMRGELTEEDIIRITTAHVLIGMTDYPKFIDEAVKGLPSIIAEAKGKIHIKPPVGKKSDNDIIGEFLKRAGM